MKKNFIIIFLILLVYSVHTQNNDSPDILLPKIDIEIEDKRQLTLDILIKDTKLPDIKFEAITKPEFSDIIKIDLEATLPERVESPDKIKPIDAIILFGYGLNNNLLADFSIFIKEINPIVSIHYLREAKENFWIERSDVKNSMSMDDFRAELLYNYKKFNLGTELGYFEKSYDLQDQSVYKNLKKRILNIDLGPSLKFDYQNDLTFRVFNSLMFLNAFGKNDASISRADLGYLLQTDLAYSQVFSNNHFITAHIGYDFNYLESKTNGTIGSFTGAYSNDFFNNIKTGISYSTMLKESFLIKASAEFLGSFRDYEFFWYILPYAKFGYSFYDYFHCYIEGGASLIGKPDQYWFKNNDYTIFPNSATPGYKWFGKTGLKGSLTGWFSGYTDLEVAYNMYGLDWALVSTEEALYTMQKREILDLNLAVGITFNVKQYLEITTEWKHSFLERNYFTPTDMVKAHVKWGAPKIGLTFFLDFIGQFLRKDTTETDMGNVYLLNGGIDWNWRERFGLGILFNNIIYFQHYQLMKYYDESGFEFIIYMKIGF
ncbi:MAG: hypothetical protein KA885_04920, partial [Spirochaetes bacterium]|nr:hypothetical protein [Spirochaetota bacterium]